MYYFTTSATDENGILGQPNVDAASGNVLRGLVPHGALSPHLGVIPASLEYHQLGLDHMLKNDPEEVGMEEAFDWTYLETLLSDVASRSRQAILKVICHSPGRPLYLPSYLRDGGINLENYSDSLGGGVSPDYGDPKLLDAFEVFISEFGARYDGDRRIGFIDLGLLGFRGEWNTRPYDFIPLSTGMIVSEWYEEAFKMTQLQRSYLTDRTYQAGIGLIDTTFGYRTLNDDSNDMIEHQSDYFWPSVKAAGQQEIWETAVVGGETHQVRNPRTLDKLGVVAGSPEVQDFMSCVNTTHASWIVHSDAFYDNFESSTVFDGLQDALYAHSRMGYNFIVSNVVARKEGFETISIDVGVEQIGISPFYYPLSLVVECDNKRWSKENTGVDDLVREGDFKMFSFDNVPATVSCLSELSIRLNSKYTYDDRPIRFAQGMDGTISMSIPLPVHTVENSSTSIIDAHPFSESDARSHDTVAIAGLCVALAFLSSLVAVCVVYTSVASTPQQREGSSGKKNRTTSKSQDFSCNESVDGTIRGTRAGEDTLFLTQHRKERMMKQHTNSSSRKHQLSVLPDAS